MREIYIKNLDNKVFIVDDEDYQRLNEFDWYVGGKRKTQLKRFKGTTIIKLTAEIFNNQAMYDHKNRNPFDFQKDNLRLATHQLNMANTEKFKNVSSKFKGVSWCQRDKVWRAYIKLNGKSRALGTYAHEVHAAEAYNLAAKKYFKDFAVLNPLGESAVVAIS